MAEKIKSTLPSAPEAEAAVLGACIFDSESCSLALEILTPEDFYIPEHRIIFESISRIFKKTRETNVDLVTVGDELRSMKKLNEIGGVAYLAELESNLLSTANAQEYIRRVKGRSILRKLIETCHKLITIAVNSDEDPAQQLDNAESLIFRIRQEQISQDFKILPELINEAILEIENLHQHKGEMSGIPTYFTKLDEMTRGLQRQELIVLAARPGMGKTALALNIAMQVAVRANYPVILFSIEMSGKRLVNRILISWSRIPSSKVNKGFINQDEFQNITDAASVLADADIFIDDFGAISLLELRAKARRKAEDLSRQGKQLGLIIIDYLQLIRYTEQRVDNRQQEVANISMSLKALAKELNVPVLALSQLSRASEQRTTRKPQLSDLRESGAIEQDADVVMFLHRDHYYNPEDEDKKNRAELIVAKQRNGPTGVINLHWTPEILRFDNEDF
ncbi:MAG: hypothetical protein APR63_05180 [Desulfuromonas sp. SDB]|nr:MAG: hypothetical protein APR63_05180 [Desulfuromonas sp. SDB]